MFVISSCTFISSKSFSSKVSIMHYSNLHEFQKYSLEHARCLEAKKSLLPGTALSDNVSKEHEGDRNMPLFVFYS